MKLSPTSILLIVAAIAGIIVLVVMMRRREGYTRAVIGQDCPYSMSPVDYVYHPEQNPERLADPGAWRQPLENGVDTDRYSRYNPDLFAQYRHDWQGY